jgi:hypothetical protein
MLPLYTQDEFRQAKKSDFLPFRCYQCFCTFDVKKSRVYNFYNKNTRHSGKYCSRLCANKAKIKNVFLNCKNCCNSFEKNWYDQIFCSQSCSATYNNKNKKSGNRRSKLEYYLESELIKIFPNLEIHFNRKDAISSELDIYIPSLKLAFELNGIFHYEPIHGSAKLAQIQNNDDRKFQACLENNIELCIIDTSSLKKFKESKSLQFLNIIISIINKKLNIV